MPKHLYLLRHAQSAEKQTAHTDKERELTPLGVKEALIMGTYLFKEKLIPDIVVSSDAVRAFTTAGIVSDALHLDLDKVSREEELYEASVRVLMAFLNQIDDAHSRVLCVGHNPSLSYLAEYITGSEIGDMVTAGLVIIKLNIQSWKEVSQGIGSFELYTYPELLE